MPNSLMRARTPTLVLAVTLGALALGGCATKKYVNEALAPVQARMAEHDTHIGELDKTSKEALDRATAAGKLAEGKFLYSVVLSDDAVKFPTNQSALSPEAQARLTDRQVLYAANDAYAAMKVYQALTDGPMPRRR